MSFQAYLDTVKEKTGKTPDDFKRMAKEKGLTEYKDVIAWLKADFGLGLGHARAITSIVLHADEPKTTLDEAIEKQFSGGKAVWRSPYDALLAELQKFGSDVQVATTSAYISLLRKDRKFGIVQVTSKNMDVGIKLKGAAAQGRLAESGNWNSMVTHRVRIDDPQQIDAELLSWLREAYQKA